jgi:type II restriction enzyme
LIHSLQCETELASRYKGPTQIARVITEHWCAKNLYCAACSADRLEQSAANTKAFDFRCNNCSETYQVKSQRRLNLNRITDGAYSALLAAVQQNVAPNLLVMNYSEQWRVHNLILVPSLFFTESVLEKRNALSADARRAGWIGCNILLFNVPPDGRIPLVHNGEILPERTVRETYKECTRLESVAWNVRGWTVDVLRIARKIGPQEFTLEQMYKFEPELIKLHPHNRNIQAKIRQQLQVLRDLKIIEFLGQGRYRFVSKPQ